MQDKQILKGIADTFTGNKPIHEMEVPVRWLPKRSLWQKITKLDYKPETSRTLTFYESVTANQIRIAGEASLLPESIFQDQSMNIQYIPEHAPRIVYMIAAAIQNNHLEPEPGLIEFIKNNLNGTQLREALVASFQTLNMEDFTDTIILMKGTVRILEPEKMSPRDGRELIASHIEV